MILDSEACYRALRARDRRFDGAFFVGVRTTGIYCRPICPARLPAADRCSFFARAAEAEREGYRACFRCRPELAPGLAPVDSMPRLVRRAAAAIDAGALDGPGGVDALASQLGITARHLRRAMEVELGVSPIEYAQTRRLALAKQLLHDTSLSLAEVAFASGFGSVRRFNALFQATFRCAPSAIRRRERVASEGPGVDAGAIALRLEYRPPLAWNELVSFLAHRAIPGVERVDDEVYRRTVRLGDVTGWVAVSPAKGARPALIAKVSRSLSTKLVTIVARLRALFDLDAQPHVVDACLQKDPLLRARSSRVPGLRLPGAFDPFEMAVRAILGQQISVKGATTLAGRLVDAFGRPSARDAQGLAEGLTATFPTADELARAPLAAVRAIGLPEGRARTILDLARGVASGAIDLAPAASPEATIAQLESVRGIGPWTAQYVAMRALASPDAFVAGDLGVRKVLGVSTSRAAEARAEAWRPWRAYAVMHLWSLPNEVPR